MSSMGVPLESENSLGDREPLPVCHEGEMCRISQGIQTVEEFRITMRFACRTSFISSCCFSDRDATDQSP